MTESPAAPEAPSLHRPAIVATMAAASGFLLTFAACGPSAALDATTVATRDSAGITIVEYSNEAVAAVPTWYAGEMLTPIGGLDTDAVHDMTNATLGVLAPSSFVIADVETIQLRQFSDRGELLAAGAGSGEGPGELSGIARLDAVSDGIAATDPFRITINLYDDSLRFRRQITLNHLQDGVSRRPWKIGADGALYTMSSPQTASVHPEQTEIVRSAITVERVSADLSTVDSLFTIAGPEGYRISTGSRIRRFTMVSLVHRIVDGFVSSDGIRWELVMRDDDGRIRRLIRLDWPRRVVTDAMRDEQLRLDHQEIDELPPGGFPGIRRIAAIDFADPRFPDSLPPFDRSRFGGDGTLWLREGSAPSDTVQRWFVFVGDSVIARLEMPVGLSLLDASRDRVLLHRTDSLDLGYIELRKVSRN